ncbi:MAG: hypothetical protein WC586_10885 [Methanoregula sp.]
MDSTRAEEFLLISLKYCLLGILTVSALAFMFVFTINWEDWFFGIKLDGLPAGLNLLGKGLAVATLGYIIIRYPRHTPLAAGMAFAFFCYLFLDSAATMQKLTNGREFPVLPGVFAIIPLVFLIVHRIVKH